MTRKQKILDLTKKEPLTDRQRRLWGHAETIELAQKRGQPLPNDVSEWLHRALKKISCGTDANEVFDVVPEKRGVRKDGFLRERQQKIVNAYIAAATEGEVDGTTPKKTSTAIKEINNAMEGTKQSTLRKNWNRASTNRKPEFTIGKK